MELYKWVSCGFIFKQLLSNTFWVPLLLGRLHLIEILDSMRQSVFKKKEYLKNKLLKKSTGEDQKYKILCKQRTTESSCTATVWTKQCGFSVQTAGGMVRVPLIGAGFFNHRLGWVKTVMKNVHHAFPWGGGKKIRFLFPLAGQHILRIGIIPARLRIILNCTCCPTCSAEQYWCIDDKSPSDIVWESVTLKL